MNNSPSVPMLQILVNGPGTCIPICVAGFILTVSKTLYVKCLDCLVNGHFSCLVTIATWRNYRRIYEVERLLGVIPFDL